MSTHSYSRCWLHLVWSTLHRERMLSKPVASKVSAYLSEYAQEKGIYMKISFVNPDHVHVLVDLPTNKTIEQVVQLFKGSSSHWINEQGLVNGRFAWGRGYGAFSVSQSGVAEVGRYIAKQDEHHHVKSFAEELKQFVERYGLVWRVEEETVETVSRVNGRTNTSLKRGVNERSNAQAPEETHL
ncbi:MAG: IS200/IS605 family transposase [Verrucomicrobiota bacterium]